MKKTTIAGMALCVTSAAFVFWFGPSALAHEGRAVGDYTISIGWRVEPAYVGVANGPEFTIAVAGQPAAGEGESHAPAEATPTGEPHTEGEATKAAEETPAADHHSEAENQADDAQATTPPSATNQHHAAGANGATNQHHAVDANATTNQHHAVGADAGTNQHHTSDANGATNQHHAAGANAGANPYHTAQAAGEQTVTEVDEAILNATETLTLTVHFGNQSRKLKLIADPETPGRFFADLIPTRPGDYTFRLTGMLGDTVIDEEFSSADGEFSTIEPAGDLLFPDTKADAVSLQSQLEALKAQVEALKTDLEAIKAAQE
jgi:hypothetical protein